MKPKKFINIGGVPYSTTAKLHGWNITIVGYDINSERHIIIKEYKTSNDTRKIELDNSALQLRERYQRVYK